jgi:hypothetical protein
MGVEQETQISVILSHVLPQEHQILLKGFGCCPSVFGMLASMVREVTDLASLADQNSPLGGNV